MTARTSLAQAKIIATRMSEDLAEDRAWFQGGKFVTVSFCECRCGHEEWDAAKVTPTITRLTRNPKCTNCASAIDDAAPDGKCAGGFIFTKHDAREA